jgi:hypothetical protein
MNEKYGNRNVAKMYKQINELRALILSEGTESIQDAWSKVEEHIDFAYAGQRGENGGDKYNKTDSGGVQHHPEEL